MPRVSFIVPCYGLAHLLSECVSSILAQNYADFEVLIMDDCSPDNTREVAQSFRDPRIRYIRNDPNLGHLRNYNKGIDLSRGEYVWLISADDRIRKPYLLEKYVNIMDGNRHIGYACCPAMTLENGAETKVDGQIEEHDRVFSGREFLKRLLSGNFVIAASGMVRKSCYEKYGKFPLDLPYAGDWFLWCFFALYYDVAYFAEPMVNYRAHELSMTNYLMKERLALTLKEGFSILWRIREEAKKIRDAQAVTECEYRLARLYGTHLAGWNQDGWMYRLTVEEFEESLAQGSLTSAEERRLRASAWMAAGDHSLKLKEFRDAGEYYRRASQYDRWTMTLNVRRLLLCTGDFGVGLTFKVREFAKAALSSR